MEDLKITKILGDLSVAGNILNKASTTTEGVVKLNDTVTSASSTEAATAKAVKAAYDKANHSHPYAPTNGSTSVNKLASSVTLGDGTSASIVQSEGSWHQRLDLKDSADKAVHRFSFSERQGEGDFVELFGVDGNGEIYSKNRKVYHTGNKPTPADIGAAPASHTHAVSDLNGRYKDVSSQDCNNILASGFYRGYNMANKPSGCTQGWIYLIVMSHDESTWVRQVAYDFGTASQVYTRVKANGTWSAWTDSSWEAINKLEIGGRNFLVGTKDFVGTWDNINAWTTDGTYKGLVVKSRTEYWAGLNQPFTVTKGEIYTFSAYVKSTASETHFYAISSGQPYCVDKGSEKVGVCDWKRFSITFTATDNGRINPRFEIGSEGKISVCGFKLEKGNRATDWSPAPEDTDKKISDVDIKVTETKNSVATLDIDLKSITSRVSETETKTTTLNTKFDNLQVGGRNLLRHTNQGKRYWSHQRENGNATVGEETIDGINCLKVVVSSTSTGWQYTSYDLGAEVIKKLEPNTDYTVGMDVKSSFTTSIKTRMMSGNTSSPLTNYSNSVDYTNENEWQRVVMKLRTGSTITVAGQVLYITGFNKVGTYYIRNLQLEKGSVASDYSVAPEDTDKKITDVEIKATEAKSAVATLDVSLREISSKVSETETKTTTLSNKIDNLKVGGTNLIRNKYITTFNNPTSCTRDANTNTWTITIANGAGGTTWGAGLRILSYSPTERVIVPYGQSYTMSFEIKVPVACNWNSDINNYPVTGSNWNSNDNDGGNRLTSIKSLQANVWTKCWVTYHNISANNTNKVDLYDESTIGIINNTGSPMTFQIRNIKGELGNICTAYSENPQDVAEATQKQIDKLEIDGRNLILNSDKGYLDDVFVAGSRTDITYESLSGWKRIKFPSSAQLVNAEVVQSKFVKLIANQPYAFSIMCRTDGSIPSSQISYWSSTHGHQYAPVTITKVADKTFKLSATFTPNAAIDARFINFVRFNTSNATYVEFRYPMLQKGSRATDWTPAPEDIDETDSINLFVKSTITRGYYLDSKGVQQPNGGWCYSDYINVKGFNQVRISGCKNLGSSPSTCFYNANKQYISGIANGTSNGVGIEQNKCELMTVPSNAAYMRCSIETAYLETAKIERGNRATPYSPNPQDLKAEITTVSNKTAEHKVELDRISSNVSKLDQKTTTIGNNVTAYEKRLTQAESKITDSAIINTVSSTIDKKINNVKVGGTNLALGTSDEYSVGYSNFSGSANNCVDIGRVLTKGLKVGDTVTFRLEYAYENIVPADGQTASCWVQGNGNVTNWSSGTFPGGARFNGVIGTGTHVFTNSWTVDAEQLKNEYWIVTIRHDYFKSGTIKWKCFMVENGTHNSSWSPSPHDVKEMVGALETQINDNVDTAILDAKEDIFETANQQYAGKGEFNQLSEQVSTMVTQTSDSITAAIVASKEYTDNSVGKDLQNYKETVETYMRFSKSGLELGESGSKFSTLLNTEKLAFKEDGQEIAYISNQKMCISNAEIQDTLRIGETGSNKGFFIWSMGQKGNLTLTWSEE